jgi:hypothetical protein
MAYTPEQLERMKRNLNVDGTEVFEEPDEELFYNLFDVYVFNKMEDNGVFCSSAHYDSEELVYSGFNFVAEDLADEMVWCEEYEGKNLRIINKAVAKDSYELGEREWSDIYEKLEEKYSEYAEEAGSQISVTKKDNKIIVIYSK